MVLLSGLFCSCFKWLIQIEHGILFLVKAAAALFELRCFSPTTSPPLNRAARGDHSYVTITEQP